MKKILFFLAFFYLLPLNVLSNEISIVDINFLLKNSEKGKKIQNLEKLRLDKKTFIYHAGTKIVNGSILSNGGRVLNVTSIGLNLLKVREKILSLIKKINWKYGFFRKDIGWKVIK